MYYQFGLTQHLLYIILLTLHAYLRHAKFNQKYHASMVLIVLVPNNLLKMDNI